MMRTLVYVSGPIFEHPGGPWEGVRAGLVAGDALLDAGFAPIVPHLNFYWKQEHNDSRTYEDFLACNLALIPRVDCVLRLEGHSVSAGLEVAHAIEGGIPVFYDIAELVRTMPACPVAELASGGVVDERKLYLVGERPRDCSNLSAQLDALRTPPTRDDPDDCSQTESTPVWDARDWAAEVAVDKFGWSTGETQFVDRSGVLCDPQPQPLVFKSEPIGETPIDRALDEIGAIFASKNKDYADESERWDSNFSDVARQMAWDSPREAAEVLIAVKQARLRALRTNGRPPANEAVADTILDRAVYAVIALAMLLEEEG